MAPLPEPKSATVEAIYALHASRQSLWRSAGLAVSEFGAECDRALWYRFRWADANDPVEPRKARLFDTGNREELRVVEELSAIGYEVHATDQDGKQFPLRALAGHVRGKADGAVLGVLEAPKTWHLLEIKSHSAKNFRALAKDKVQKAFPKHYAQCQIGMQLTGMDRCLYVGSCKDTDELHAERLPYDVEYGLRAIARAERIARTDRAPAKLHDDPKSKAAFACGYCPSRIVCHESGFPTGEPHCRTCLHAEPTFDGDGAWACRRWDRPLSLDEQKEGCPAHLFLPDLVPGEQIDASEQQEWVEYRLATGDIWRDGARAEAAV